MITFLLGVMFGVAVFYAALRGRNRLGIASRVERLLLSVSEPSAASVHKEVIQDLRAVDPELAKAIESEPAVPVADVPETIAYGDQKEIENAPTQHAAEAVAARFIPNPDLRRAVVELSRWRTRRNNSEKTYQNSFRAYAQKNNYAVGLAEKERLKWRGDRMAIPDFILERKVLVEIKTGLAKSGEIDRALGQMLRYLIAWKGRGPAVLAICGEASPEVRWLVLTYVNTWRKQLRLPVMAFFKQGSVNVLEEPEMPTEKPLLDDVDE